MSGASFEVSGQPGSPDCKVKLNGEEIQSNLRGITIRSDDVVYRVELDVIVIDQMTFDTQWADVHVPLATRDLLIKLGWTPPKENP